VKHPAADLTQIEIKPNPNDLVPAAKEEISILKSNEK
jgi:hypothetical protein